MRLGSQAVEGNPLGVPSKSSDKWKVSY